MRGVLAQSAFCLVIYKEDKETFFKLCLVS